MSSPAYTQALSVTGGRIRGIMTEDGAVSVYLGIPYGAAPVGTLRFREPQPPVAWSDVLTCDHFGMAPVQQPQMPFLFWTREFIIRDTGYGEDCLTANVWTSNDGCSAKPVLVYFHGGGFNTGGSSCEIYDGEQMARRGTVFVSFNHRVGVPSLYTSPELDAEMPSGTSGNCMLLDAIQLLKWIRDNIRTFGGDPENVTLMGQSSGAGEINALTVSSLARGLFRRVIAMSMNSLKPKGHAEEWRTHMDEQTMWREVYPEKTLADMRQLMTEDMVIRFPRPARPCIDGAVLDMNYREGLVQGRTTSIDVMLGAVAGDTRIVNTCYGVFVGNSVEMTHEQMTERLRTFFGVHFDEAAALYPLLEKPVPEVLREIDTDLLLGGMLAVARLRKEHGGGQTYVYYYDHLMPGSEQFGVFHSSEVPYMLNNLTHDRGNLWKPEDRKFSDRLADMVASFAATGCPGQGWSATAEANYEYLSAEDCAQRWMSPEKYAFWMKVFN